MVFPDRFHRRSKIDAMEETKDDHSQHVSRWRLSRLSDGGESFCPFNARCIDPTLAHRIATDRQHSYMTEPFLLQKGKYNSLVVDRRRNGKDLPQNSSISALNKPYRSKVPHYVAISLRSNNLKFFR